MQKDFITATPDSGTGGGTVTTTAAVNTAFQDKQTTLNVSGGGITRSVEAMETGVPFLFELGINVWGNLKTTIYGAAVFLNSRNTVADNQASFSILNGAPTINMMAELRYFDSEKGVNMGVNPILLIKKEFVVGDGPQLEFWRNSEAHETQYYHNIDSENNGYAFFYQAPQVKYNGDYLSNVIKFYNMKNGDILHLILKKSDGTKLIEYQITVTVSN